MSLFNSIWENKTVEISQLRSSFCFSIYITEEPKQMPSDWTDNIHRKITLLWQYKPIFSRNFLDLLPNLTLSQAKTLNSFVPSHGLYWLLYCLLIVQLLSLCKPLRYDTEPLWWNFFCVFSVCVFGHALIVSLTSRRPLKIQFSLFTMHFPSYCSAKV